MEINYDPSNPHYYVNVYGRWPSTTDARFVPGVGNYLVYVSSVPPRSALKVGVYALAAGIMYSLADGSPVVSINDLRNCPLLTAGAYIPLWHWSGFGYGSIPTGAPLPVLKLLLPFMDAKVGDTIVLDRNPYSGAIQCAFSNGSVFELTTSQQFAVLQSVSHPLIPSSIIADAHYPPLFQTVIEGYTMPEKWETSQASDKPEGERPIIKHPGLNDSLIAQIRKFPTAIPTRVLINNIVKAPMPEGVTDPDAIVNWINQWYTDNAVRAVQNPFTCPDVTVLLKPEQIAPGISMGEGFESTMYEGERVPSLPLSVEINVRDLYSRADLYSGEMQIPVPVIQLGTAAIERYIKRNYACLTLSEGEMEHDEEDYCDIDADFEDLIDHLDELQHPSAHAAAEAEEEEI